MQRQILDWLKLHRVFHFRNNSGAMTGVHRGKRWFMRFGMRGSADILCCRDGRLIAIEVKGPRGEQSREQIVFQAELEKAGGVYILARSLDDVTTALGPLRALCSEVAK